VIGFDRARDAWAFEVTPEGIKRTEVADAKLPQKAGRNMPDLCRRIGAAISVALFFVGRYNAGKTVAVAPNDIQINRSPFCRLKLSEEKPTRFRRWRIRCEILTHLANR
jgi:hypothetical protein